MTITIELPGDELVEMALRYHALKDGKTIENYCVESVLASLEGQGDKKISQIYNDWRKQLYRPELATALESTPLRC